MRFTRTNVPSVLNVSKLRIIKLYRSKDGNLFFDTVGLNMQNIWKF